MAKRYLYIGTTGPIIWDTADTMPGGGDVAVLRLRTASLGAGSDLLVLYEDGSIEISGQATPILDSNSDQVVGDRKAAVADASSVSALTLQSGGDSVDRAAFNTSLSTLVTEINNAITQLNALLNRVRASTGHGLIA